MKNSSLLARRKHDINTVSAEYGFDLNLSINVLLMINQTLLLPVISPRWLSYERPS